VVVRVMAVSALLRRNLWARSPRDADNGLLKDADTVSHTVM
jgi:hypothetical protein